MEAFELPSLSKKKLFLTRKKRNISPLAVKNEQATGSKIQQQSSDKNNLQEYNNNQLPRDQNDDTLSGIPDFTDEGVETEKNCKKEKYDAPKIQHNIEIPLSESRNNDEYKNYSPGGFCKICLQRVPKHECKMHFKMCMKTNFASRQDLKLKIESKTKCPKCKINIDVRDYEGHSLTCRSSKSESPTETKPITSSYFKPLDASTTLPRREKDPCPSCNINLAGFTISAKRSHVNR